MGYSDLKYPRQDSNLQPPVPETGAILPIGLRGPTDQGSACSCGEVVATWLGIEPITHTPGAFGFLGALVLNFIPYPGLEPGTFRS